MQTDIYNAQGKKAGSLELPENIFGLPWNESLIHQVVTSMQDNARTPVAHTKGRGDVRGGGKKPWNQKGTGRARHSSIRSPIWRGGGVTHGPRKEKNYSRTIPKGMRIKALAVALSRKFKNGEIVFVDSFGIDTPKTAAVKKALVSIGKALELKGMEKAKNAALIALSDPREAAVKSFRNIGNVELRSVRELNPLAVLKSSYLLIEDPSAALAILTHRIGGAKAAPVEKAKKSTRKSKNSPEAKHLQERGDQ